MLKKLYIYSFVFLFAECFFSTNYGVELSIITSPIGLANAGYGGHTAVTRSLVEGLQKIGVSFNYNPKNIEYLKDIVIVLSDPYALSQIIQLKREGRIKKIVAGPNLMVRSNENGGILASPEIDICIVPSDWVKNAYIEDEPTLQGRIQVWYAGVDESYWNPGRDFAQKNNDGCKKVLVYWKTEPESFYRTVEKILKQQGWQPICLRYGHHSHRHYKHTLETVLFSVFLSRSESQGIALAESWAMDVPTLVWDAQSPHVINSKTYWPILSAPYISNQTGLVWNTYEELEIALNNMNLLIQAFTPRQWILEKMSDEISAQLLINIVNAELNKDTTLVLK